MKCPKCQHENPQDSTFCGKCATPLNDSDQEFVTKTLITPAAKLVKGSIIAGKYQILEELGRGGMGVVYKAADTKLKRAVALKFLPPELTHIPDIKERFIREAQAAAALDHPNICTVYEFDEDEEKSFISMAFIQGQNLKKKIESGPLDPGEALRIATQIAEGLQEAHKKGVVHRDIKSANIMLDEKNFAKIMDFGLARKTGGTLITKEGTAMGTIAYMSPEQARGEEVDFRTDIWSLGVVMYEMFGGQLPFKGQHEQAVLYSIRNDHPKPIADLCPKIPVPLAQVISKALEKSPDKRYQRVEELLDDLKSISAGIMPDDIRVRLRKARLHKRKRWLSYAGISCFALLATVVTLSLFTGNAEAIGAVAVLPLENLTGNAGQDYFVDGATDELIGQLTKIGAWRVISRTTVMHYKGVSKPLPEIARELNVDAIVEGTFYEIGDSVRMSVKLIDVLPEEKNLWSQTYSRDKADVLLMYSEMARAIADRSQVSVTAEEMTRLSDAGQVDSEAYDAYLKGLYNVYKLTPQNLALALQYFELVLKKDPDNAMAHAGIAFVWAVRYQMALASRDEQLRFGKAAAEKALELDNSLAEAHYSLACIQAWTEWDWDSADLEFQRALQLKPNFADAHGYYSFYLSHMGRYEEAQENAERAVERDPLNPTWHALAAYVHLYRRRFDEALAAGRNALALGPGNSVALNVLSQALIAKKRHDELLELQREIFAQYPEVIAAQKRGIEEDGYEGANRAIADLLASRYGAFERWGNARQIAIHFVEAGEYEQAMHWLEQGYKDHIPNLPSIGVPVFDPLRSDPRYQALLRRMGLPAEGKE
jgi:TolB-like protein/tetratricopeptide (TPR) repeat protein/predicted Ser/Thr protein kinase